MEKAIRISSQRQSCRKEKTERTEPNVMNEVGKAHRKSKCKSSGGAGLSDCLLGPKMLSEGA